MLESAIIWTLNAGAELHGGGAREKRCDRRGNSGSVRSGSCADVEAGEHQHARICGRGRQRDDRGSDRRAGQRNEPEDSGASAGADAERFGSAGALANPTLDLVNSSGTVVRSNNDWGDDSVNSARRSKRRDWRRVTWRKRPWWKPSRRERTRRLCAEMTKPPASGWWRFTIFRSESPNLGSRETLDGLGEIFACAVDVNNVKSASSGAEI